MPTPARPGGISVTFAAHADFIEAISAAATARGMTRSALIRKVLADFVQAAGQLAPGAPVTRQAARRYR